MAKVKRQSAGSLFKNRVKRDGKIVEFPHWYGRYKDEFGKWQKVKLYTDKDASNTRLQEIIRDVERRAVGIHTPDMDHAGRPLTEHVTAYLESLKLENRDPEHQRIAKWMLNKLVEIGQWKRIGDITAESMRAILLSLDRQGKTPSYQNKFIKRAKAFVHWAQRDGRLTLDPLSNLKRASEAKGKKTRARRPLSDAEAAALITTAPDDRKLKYAFPLLAGIRRSEFADLLWGDLRLNAPRPFIRLRPEQTKNRKADVLPLHSYLVLLLRAMIPGEPDHPVINSVPDMKTMARDLLNAGVAELVREHKPGCVTIAKGKYINVADSRGLRADFHALRHTFCTNLERAGCSETTRKALMRHAHEGVTAGYSHARIAELYTAIDRLPVPWLHQNAPRDSEAQVATGTDGAAPGFCWTNVGQEACSEVHGDAQACADDGVALGAGNANQPSVRSGGTDRLCADVHAYAQGCTSVDHNLLIDKGLRPSTQVD